MLRAQPLMVIKNRRKVFEIEADDDYDPSEKPRVRFIQEVRRVHSA